MCFMNRYPVTLTMTELAMNNIMNRKYKNEQNFSMFSLLYSWEALYGQLDLPSLKVFTLVLT